MASLQKKISLMILLKNTNITEGRENSKKIKKLVSGSDISSDGERNTQTGNIPG